MCFFIGAEAVTVCSAEFESEFGFRHDLNLSGLQVLHLRVFTGILRVFYGYGVLCCFIGAEAVTVVSAEFQSESGCRHDLNLSGLHVLHLRVFTCILRFFYGYGVLCCFIIAEAVTVLSAAFESESGVRHNLNLIVLHVLQLC